MSTVRNARPGWGLVLIAAVSAGAFAWRAGADAARHAAPPPTAVAAIDPDRVLGQLNEVKDRDAVLKSRREEFQKQLEEIEKELEALNTDVKNLQPGTKEWRAKRAQQIEVAARGKARKDSLQQILDLEQGAVMKEMYEKIVVAAADLAKREGWDVLLLDDRAMVNLPDEGTFRDMGAMIRQKKVLYVAERVDISDQVANFMNNAHRAPVP